MQAHLPLLDARWIAGCHSGVALWRRFRPHGFRGSFQVVSEWAPRRCRAETASDQQLQRIPSARAIARLMTSARDHLSKADTITVAAIEGGVPTLVEARTLLKRFQAMVRLKRPDVDRWIGDAATSLLASFAAGLSKDKPAVTAAMTSLWSNGQRESQITKLKLLVRQMCGRAKIDLLNLSVIEIASDPELSIVEKIW